MKEVCVWRFGTTERVTVEVLIDGVAQLQRVAGEQVVALPGTVVKLVYEMPEEAEPILTPEECVLVKEPAAPVKLAGAGELIDAIRLQLFEDWRKSEHFADKNFQAWVIGKLAEIMVG